MSAYIVWITLGLHACLDASEIDTNDLNINEANQMNENQADMQGMADQVDAISSLDPVNKQDQRTANELMDQMIETIDLSDPDQGNSVDFGDEIDLATQMDMNSNSMDQILPMSQCGNAVLEEGEACDASRLGPPIDCPYGQSCDYCTVECQVAVWHSPYCGDEMIEDAYETCDDGNDVDGDGCDASCQVELGYTCVEEPSLCTTQCGDGIVAGEEICDERNSTTFCDYLESSCQVCVACQWQAGITQYCGDQSIQNDFEECDDGNDDNTDDCLNHCQLAYCGDGWIHSTLEACDDGNRIPSDGCTNCQIDVAHSCTGTPSTCEAWCGDGTILAGVEVCDDGNRIRGDGCSRNCNEIELGFSCQGQPSRCTPICGDGILRGEEICDDGNQNTELCPYDMSSCLVCSPSCERIAGRAQFCGDGLINPDFEECDDGNLANLDGCSALCQVENPNRICGNGMVEGDEICDDGNQNDQDACTHFCQPALCGDGFTWIGQEACDDGNQIDNDGCSNQCTFNVEGACINEQDRSIVEGEDGFVSQLFSLSVSSCIGFIATPQLIPDCVSGVAVSQLDVSVDCADCFGGLIACTLENCLISCSGNFNGGPCLACLETNACIDDLLTCTGPLDTEVLFPE